MTLTLIHLMVTIPGPAGPVLPVTHSEGHMVLPVAQWAVVSIVNGGNVVFCTILRCEIVLPHSVRIHQHQMSQSQRSCAAGPGT